MSTDYISTLAKALRVPNDALVIALRAQAQEHLAFVPHTTNKAAALDLADACNEAATHLADGDLLAVLREVRTQVPALHAARKVLEASV